MTECLTLKRLEIKRYARLLLLMGTSLFAMTGIIKAQVSLPYSYGFEDDSYSSYWTLETGNSNDWVIGTATSNSGSYSAYISDDNGASASFSSDNEDEVDLSFQVDLTGCASATISFDYKCGGGTYTTGGRNSTTVIYAYGEVLIDNTEILTEIYNVTSWNSKSIDLSDYVGKSITVTFRWHNEYYKNNIPNGGTTSNTGFCIDNVGVTATLDDLTDFTATASTTSSDVDLTWGLNDASDTVIIVSSLSHITDSPTVGTIYNAGDELADGVTILYKGITTDGLTDTPLNYGTTYYYEAWSTRNGLYSAGSADDALTMANSAVNVVLSEDWEDSSNDDVTWSTWTGIYNSSSSSYVKTTTTDNSRDRWLQYGDAESSNTDGQSAYITYGKADTNGAIYNSDYASTIRTVLYCGIDLSDFSSGDECNLIFDWLCDGYSKTEGYSNDAYGRVFIQVGSDIDKNTATRKYFGGISSGTGGTNRYYGETEWQTEHFDLIYYCDSITSAGYTGYGNVILGFEWDQSGDNSTSGTPNNPPSFCVDNILITDASSTASITKVSSGISSLVNSSDDAEDNDAGYVIDVSFKDKNNSNTTDTYPTIIKKFVLSHGDENEIEDWSKAIAGAELYYDGSVVENVDIDINSSNITFTFDDGLTIEEEETQDYQLYIWLNTDLYDNGINDGDEFDFLIENDQIVTGSNSDAFVKGESSSSTGIPIEIEATTLVFITQPSSTASYGTALGTDPVIAAVDANGNVDTDVDNVKVTISNSGSLTMGINSSTKTSTVTLTDGIATINGLTFYDEDATEGTTVTLTATTTDYGSATSNEIVIYYTPSNSTSGNLYISNVSFGDIDQDSGNDDDDNGYISYADTDSTTLAINEEETISITVRHNYSYTVKKNTTRPPGYLSVWVDWNQDGAFVDDEICISKKTVAYQTDYYETVTATISVPDDAEYGSTVMRVLFTTDATSDADDDNDDQYIVAETEDYKIVVSNEQYWTGATSTAWATTTNWSTSIVPRDETDVTIPYDGISNFPVISTGASMHDLTIKSNASCTVSAGDTLHIYGDFVNNGTFTISNDLTEDAESISSIIIDGDVSGEATEVWSNMEGNLWWYFSNPMSDVSPADYANSYSTSYYVRLYNNSTFSYAGNTSSSTTYFDGVDAFGYAILNSKEDNTLTYSGTFNTEYYSHTAEYESENSYYQYVGNPYPSYIDFSVIYNNSSSTLSADDASSCYIYTLSTESGSRGYATYNAESDEYVGSNARYISPGQCFWIQMNEGDEITITKDACTNSHDSEKPVSLKGVSASTDSKTKIRLVLSNSNTDDEVLIIGDGNNGSDEITKYDSRKKMNSGVIGNIYTIKNDTGIVINSLPEFYDGDIIPLGYSVSSSGMTDFTISVSSLTNAGDYEIYLDDLQEGTSIQLTDTTAYTFTPSVASSDDRFQIRVASSESTEETETTTGIDDATSSDNISVYSSGQTAYVTVSEEWLQSSSREIDVYNVAGQLMQTVELNDLETSFSLPDTGVYLIKVVSGSMIYTEKVLGE